MLPVLVFGIILTWLIASFYAPAYWRIPTYIFGFTLTASLVNFIYRPFVQVSVLDQIVMDGVATTRFVPTGLWALDGMAYGGTSVSNIRPGEIGTLTSETPHPVTDQFTVELIPHTPPWVWLALSLIWAVPLVLSVTYFLYARAKGWDLLPEESSEEEPAMEASEPSSEELAVSGN